MSDPSPYPGAPPHPPDPRAYPVLPPPPGYASPLAAAYGANPDHVRASAQINPAPPQAGRALGIVALALALLALIAPAVAGAIAAFSVGIGVGDSMTTATPAGMSDLSVLSPVREWVLVCEVAFWTGTALGMWAIAQGVVAIVRRRGRGQGIAAVIIAPIAFVVFGICVCVCVFVGMAAAPGTAP